MKEKIPPGYSQWVSVTGRVILVPDHTAKALEKALETAVSDDRSGDLTLRVEERNVEKEATPKAQSWRERFGEDAPAGHMRVLHGYDAIASDQLREQMVARRADHDDQVRVRRLMDKLKDRGPDRKVGRPSNWPESLDALEQLLPHFREPIRFVSNTLALAEVSATPIRVPPMLLLGPPGVGKTLFSHRLAEVLGVPNAAIAFDHINAGSQLYGSDKFWGNTQCGLLFQLLCEGEYANPVVLLDEVDKASVGSGSASMDPLAQLHGALEVQTARRAKDASTDIEFDSSLVTYVATANTLEGIGVPLLSRFEIFVIDPPSKSEGVGIARHIAKQTGERLGLAEPIEFDRKCFYILAHMSPRLMVRTVNKAVAEAVAHRRRTVTEQDVWRLAGFDDPSANMH